jgi:hypothetical protein
MMNGAYDFGRKLMDGATESAAETAGLFVGLQN